MKMGSKISVSKGGRGNVHAAADVGSVRPRKIYEEGGFLFRDIILIPVDFSCFIGIDFCFHRKFF